MRKITMLLLVTIIISCNNNKSNEGFEISINISNNKEVNIDKKDIICFNNSQDKVIIDKIKKISIFNDNAILVQSQNNLTKYDISDGEELVTYSGMGHTTKEYLSLWDHWIDKDGCVNIYDMNGKKIIKYSANGKYINNIALSAEAKSSPFQSLVPYKDGYLGKRVYNGLDTTKELALYDSNFKFMESICNFKMKSGIKFGRQFCSYSNRVLYNRYFENIIYEIKDEGEKVRYNVDFSDKTVDNIDSFVDEYEIIDYINSFTPDKFCTMIANISESDNYFTFTFLYNSNKCVAIYDKKADIINTYSFTANDMILTYIDIYNENIYLFFEDKNDSYFKKLNISELR